MSLKIRKLSEEPGEPMEGEDVQGVNSVMAVTRMDDVSAFSARLMRLNPGGHTGFHEHPRVHAVLVLSGRIRVETGDEVKHAESGSVISIPSNMKHRFFNPSDQTVAIMVLNMFKEEPEESQPDESVEQDA